MENGRPPEGRPSALGPRPSAIIRYQHVAISRGVGAGDLRRGVVLELLEADLPANQPSPTLLLLAMMLYCAVHACVHISARLSAHRTTPPPAPHNVGAPHGPPTSTDQEMSRRGRAGGAAAVRRSAARAEHAEARHHTVTVRPSASALQVRGHAALAAR